VAADAETVAALGCQARTDQPAVSQNPLELTDNDRLILANIDSSLAKGRLIKSWWEEREAKRDYAEQFTVVRTFNQPDLSIGFFDRVALPGEDLRVMGVVQEMLYDNPKRTPPEALRKELREFIFRYFLHVSDFREPEAFVDDSQPRLPRPVALLSWCPDEDPRTIGFGYSQLYYKLRGSNEVAKFEKKEECAIVDIRQIGTKYEWLVVKVRVFNFDLTFTPFGPGTPSLKVPLNEETYIILSPEFITVTDGDEKDKPFGQYGFGYAILKYEREDGIFAYGPGRFRAGFQLINFDLSHEGISRVKLVFVVDRPQRVLRIDIDPVGWTYRVADLLSAGLVSRLAGPFRPLLERFPVRIPDFDPVTTYIALANLFTAGLAERQFCISLKQLEKEMLVQHFMEHYRLIVGSLLTWRQIPDWLDTERLPAYVVTGIVP